VAYRPDSPSRARIDPDRSANLLNLLTPGTSGATEGNGGAGEGGDVDQFGAGDGPTGVGGPRAGEDHADHAPLVIDHRGTRISGLDDPTQLDALPGAFAVEGDRGSAEEVHRLDDGVAVAADHHPSLVRRFVIIVSDLQLLDAPSIAIEGQQRDVSFGIEIDELSAEIGAVGCGEPEIVRTLEGMGDGQGELIADRRCGRPIRDVLATARQRDLEHRSLDVGCGGRGASREPEQSEQPGSEQEEAEPQAD
jgi:hypothetical protein